MEWGTDVFQASARLCSRLLQHDRVVAAPLAVRFSLLCLIKPLNYTEAGQPGGQLHRVAPME